MTNWLKVSMSSWGYFRHGTHDDALVTIRLASREDATKVTEITDDAYSKYIQKLGRKPEPMMADYGEMITKHPVHILRFKDQPVGVLVLKHEEDQTLIWSVAIHNFKDKGWASEYLSTPKRKHRRIVIKAYNSTRTRYSKATSPFTNG